MIDWAECNPFELDIEHEKLSDDELKELVVSYWKYQKPLRFKPVPIKRMSIPMARVIQEYNMKP